MHAALQDAKRPGGGRAVTLTRDVFQSACITAERAKPEGQRAAGQGIRFLRRCGEAAAFHGAGYGIDAGEQFGREHRRPCRATLLAFLCRSSQHQPSSRPRSKWGE